MMSRTVCAAPVALMAGDQHDVLGMIIAQHRDRAEAVVGDRPEYVGPGQSVGIYIDLDPDRVAGVATGHLKPAVQLSETPPYWARPSVPLGYHRPVWP